MADQFLDQVRDLLEIGVGPIGLEHGELWIVLSRDSFVPEIPVQLEHFVEAADQQAFEIKLRRDAEIKLQPERFVMGSKRLGRGPARHGLQHRRLHFEKAPRFEEIASLAHDRDPLFKDGARLLVREKIEVALPVTGLDILKSVPFLGERAQRFSQKLELVHFQRRLAGLGEEAGSLYADEIPEIDQLEHLDHVIANFLRVDVNLDPPGGIAQIHEMAFAHVAMRGDPAGRAQGGAFRELFADLGDCAGSFISVAERVRAARLKRFQFFTPLCDQAIFVVHLRAANLENSRTKDTRNTTGRRKRFRRLFLRDLCVRRVSFSSRPVFVCKKKEGDEILALAPSGSAPGPATSFMPLDLPQTASKTDGPLVKQFSIFLPNKVGAMLDVVKLLHAHNTHVVALSISESTDSAIARIVVSDPEQVEELFREHDVPFGVCAMVVVELREVATELAKLLAALLMAEVNVHFSYPLLTHPRGFAALALHVDDTDCASSVLLGEGFKLLSQADISR